MIVRLYCVVQVAGVNLPAREKNVSTACAGDENSEFGDNFPRKMTTICIS
jgi:hypothetical protein